MATNFLKNSRTFPEHLYVFQEHVTQAKFQKFVLVILRLGALNEYQKQNNINKNVLSTKYQHL